MSQKSKLNFYEIKNAAKSYDDDEALAHIFSVVSSLDSLVIGESQITGKVTDAFKLSMDHGTAGEKLNRVRAYEPGKYCVWPSIGDAFVGFCRSYNFV